MENSLYKIILLPEISLTILTCCCLILGLYSKKNSYLKTINASIFSLTITILLIVVNIDIKFAHYDELFLNNSFIQFFKIIIVIGSLTSIIISKNYFIELKIAKFEVPILLMFSTIGMLIMISSNNLMLMYLAIELQSLSLYVLAAIKRNSLVSAESGVKYFILGALSSGILLYGCSLIYGFTGTTSFEKIYLSLNQLDDLNLGIIFGLVFILVGLAFKVSAVPFHMWTPDVYEGAPTSVTSFFAIIPKIAAITVFIRFMYVPFLNVIEQWQMIIVFISIASMILGATAAIGQKNIKRLMAYSSIGHMGYALAGLAPGTNTGIQSTIIYLIIYLVMNLGAFGCIFMMKRENAFCENINDLSGMSKNHPILALSFLIILFSLAGIPPLAGFFAKFYIFMAVIKSEMYILAILGLLTTVISAFYYLRIIKIIYFDKPKKPFELNYDWGLKIPLILSSVLVLIYFIYPSLLVDLISSIKII